jgi:predicted TIM-barrel fold metal-dependent hydrolase
MAVIDVPTRLGYLINDADEHSTPRPKAYEDYIDPDKRDMAIRTVRGPDGRSQQLFNGRLPRFDMGKDFQVTFAADTLDELGVSASGGRKTDDDTDGENRSGPANLVPGSLLNRLNPLRSLDEEGRKEFVRRYRELQDQLDNPADRLAVMDAQGVECVVNYAALPGIEVEFEDDYDGLYANLVALNRYLGTEWGYNYGGRLFTPPFVSFADPEAALVLLEEILKIETPRVIQTSNGTSMHTSPFRPENDRFWSVCSEAGIRLATHLASVTRFAANGEAEWNEPEATLGGMTAFQWVLYHGDRPAMETVAAAILQGWFVRFPDMLLLLSEQGTVWAPYIVRKMDHAFLMGRRGTWGKLEKRPSEYFKEHCFVAPFPEENVYRVMDVTGIEPLVFGSDFPHGEGLPEPGLYLSQIEDLGEDDQKAIMRGNLARYLRTAA